jgi:hypothetical protein
VKHTSFQLANESLPKRPPIPNVPDPAARAATVTTKTRHNRSKKEREPMPEPKTVAVATVSLELGIPVDELAARLAADVTIDPAGCRAISVERAKAFIAATNAQRQQARDEEAQRWREQLARPHPTRERVRRLARRPTPADPSISAFAMLVGGTTDDPLERAGGHMSEMLSNATSMTYHRIRSGED